MTIVDDWDNPVTLGDATLIGYRGTFTQFPHDLYSFILSTIRQDDEADVGLLYRWTRPMQLLWEELYGKILSLPDLLSPEKCEYKYLDYLKKKVGITDNLNYLWGVLSENEKRTMIKYFIRFVQYRGTSLGISEMMETMTGQPALYLSYFYYRWIISGDNDYEIESALGRDDDGHDTWLLSEDNIPVGVTPNLVYAQPLPGVPAIRYYQFVLDELIEQVENDPIPPKVRVKCKLTGESAEASLIYGTLYDDLGAPFDCYYAQYPLDYFFGMTSTSLSTTVTDFQASFEPDNYVSDILITDDGSLNRDMARAIVKFQRPLSERTYIRYYKLIELFEDLNRWLTISGTVVHDADEQTVTLGDPADTTILMLDYDSTLWEDYCIHIKCKFLVDFLYSEVRFMYQNDMNHYKLRWISNVPPGYPAGAISLTRVMGGAQVVLGTAYVDQLDLGVDYIFRIECFTSHRVAGDVQVLRIYQDENLLIEYTENPMPALWATIFGNIELVAQTGGELVVTSVLVHPIPGESDYVGP